ncbi:MAG TPA: mechanosensitive ion channel domain-containing protein [Mycobacteriales bacterium]|nr:mechanosensitive ion channel domain-containing protein [Mycobacteriales bacterium]
MSGLSALALGGVRLVGVDAHTGLKLAYTLVLIVAVIGLRWAARWTVRRVLRGRSNTSARFWARQGINLASAVILVLGALSIWFDNGLHAAAAAGLISAGVAFAMQKAITSVAGYFLILRGDIFSIGDRIVMGGVRGDVIGLGFLRTSILEMGQPTGDEDTGAPVWIDGRQYTGRIVTVTNGVVFDEPVYNYSRDFPFLWEELRIPIKYDADRARAEEILMTAARGHSIKSSELGSEAIQQMRRRFYVPSTDLEPEVFYKLTDNWLELAVRFVVPTHGIRKVKSDISREILDGFQAAGIEVASGTYAIVEVPPLRVVADPPDGRASNGKPRKRAKAARKSSADESDPVYP